jgi:hypothetical protein
MTFALVVAITLLGGAAAISVRRHMRLQAAERAAALQQVADRIGWSYREQVDFRTIPDLKRFELFRQGSGQKLRHVLMSPADEIRGVLFEYSYTVSTGKSSHTVTQTVFYGTCDALDLPSFSLRPEHFFHRVAGILGYQDINFERRPEFSRLFLLRGENEGRIRAVFGDAVLAFFEGHGGCCAAGMGREVLFWRPGKRLDPHEFEAFISEGFDLAGRLLEGCRARRQPG